MPHPQPQPRPPHHRHPATPPHDDQPARGPADSLGIDPARTLLVVAAPEETRAVLRGLGALPLDAPGTTPLPPVATLIPTPTGPCVVRSGVGKVNAALAVALAHHPSRFTSVLSVGIGGLLPDAPPQTSAAGPSLATPGSPTSGFPTPTLLDAVLASRSLYADEGLVTGVGYRTIADLGFPQAQPDTPPLPDTDVFFPHPEMLQRLRPVAATLAGVATVSTCSGTAAAAHAVATRTGARVEAMEGAAVAHALVRLGHPPAALPFAELRVISNTTGDRATQIWRLREALARLTDLSRDIAAALR